MFNGLVEDWFNSALNIDYAEFITNRRLGLPMVNIQCDFVTPSKIGEIITLTLKVERIGNSSIHLLVQALYVAKVRVSAKLTICVNSLATGRAVRIPDDLRQRLSEFRDNLLDRQEKKS